MTATVHVLVVADATSARRRLGALFADSAHFEVTAEADDVASALAQARATRPAVVVVDLPLSPEELAQAADLLRVIDPDVHVVVLPGGAEAAASVVVDIADAMHLTATPSSMPAPRPPTAVVCDDDSMTRRLVGQVLAKLQIDVVADIDAVPNLLPVVQMTHPDLVVLDLWLEGTTGLSSLPDLCAMSPSPTVVVYSGRAEWERRALDAGAAAFVLKPRFDELEAAVRTLVPAGGHLPI